MRPLFPLLVFVTTVGLLVSPSQLSRAREDAREISDRNRNAVLKCLRRVTSATDIAIRLYYSATCTSNSEDPIPFPFTKVQPPPEGKIGAAAVREIFKNDKEVTVSEERGVVRIWIGKVPTAVLQTKIPRLTLDRIGQYNPDQAIIAINNTKEMEAATQSLGLSPVWSASSSRALPAKELPHLSASIKDMTVEQILDVIAKTWDGPVIYGACGEPTGTNYKRRFLIDSAQDVIPKGAWRKMGIQRPE